MKRVPEAHVAIPCTIALFLLAFSVVLAPRTYGRGSFPGTWSNVYPSSSSLDNAAAAGSACYLCHTPNGTSSWNPYGNAVKRKLDSGMSITQALAAVESDNSDKDAPVPPTLPEGWTNLMEITAGAQPGWTSGQNDYYDADGYLLGSMPAPSGLVDLDPSGTVDTAPVTWGRLKTAFPD